MSRIIHGHVYGYLSITAKKPHEKIFTSSSSDISSMNKSFQDPDHPLRQDDLHPHWWLNPLKDEQPVELWARIQPSIQPRRCGWPRNSRSDPSAFEIAAARARNQVAGQYRVGKRGNNIRGRGRGQGHGRGEANARNLPCEDQPRRAGLQRRTEPEGGNSSKESQ